MPMIPDGPVDRPKSNAPIFQRRPELLEKFSPAPKILPAPEVVVPWALPVVQPLCIFAAGKESFEAIVRNDDPDGYTIKAVLFRELPLAANGWDYEATHIKRLGLTGEGARIWRVSRGVAE